MIRTAVARNPTADHPPPVRLPELPATAPNSEISANVRIPAMTESTFSRWSPTRSPRPRATASRI